MINSEIIGKIKELYGKGENILEFLKMQGNAPNDVESIMISYDFQAGTYTKLAVENSDYLNQYTNAITEVFAALPAFKSVMEVGVGEATLMNPLMSKVDPFNKVEKFGFDISWSRVRYAKQNSEKAGNSISLFIANLFEIPLADNAIDIVYTSHSLEPNGGKEKQALTELYRVTKNYLVLLEPDYENATSEGKARMIRHGYVQNLEGHASELGMKVIKNSPFGVCINPLNPTGLTIIEKKQKSQSAPSGYVCPISKKKLEKHENVLFSQETGLLYPIIDNIPCLLSTSAVLASHFMDFR